MLTYIRKKIRNVLLQASYINGRRFSWQGGGALRELDCKPHKLRQLHSPTRN